MKSYLFLAIIAFLFVNSSYGQNTVKDVDGNEYKVIKYNGYLIMTENLRTTHYRDGSEIPRVKKDRAWENAIANKQEGYCAYDNKKSNAKKYGLLYTAETIQSEKGLAPEGWYIPTSNEWVEIFAKRRGEGLKVYTVTPKMIKEEFKRAKRQDDDPYIAYEFAAIGGGRRVRSGEFKYLEDWTYLSGRNDGFIGLQPYGSYHTTRISHMMASNMGLSVRCVKKLE